MHILFFGNDYNRLSVACAEELVRLNGHTVTIGLCQPEGDGLVKTTLSAWRQYGFTFVLKRGRDLLRARFGVVRRRFVGTAGPYHSLRELATAYGIHVQDCTHLRAPETVNALRDLQPDLGLVAGFSRILKPDVISIPRLGCINVHPSLLPQYRGPNPLYWVLHRGEQSSGVTIHFVDVGIDSGDVVAQETIELRPHETEATLLAQSISMAARMVRETVKAFEEGTVERTPQNENAASYYSHPPRGASTL